jgi:hypothetical protein
MRLKQGIPCFEKGGMRDCDDYVTALADSSTVGVECSLLSISLSMKEVLAVGFVPLQEES